MTIDSWLTNADAALRSAGIPTSRLDAEVILAHTLRQPRTYLHAHIEAQIEPRTREIADARLSMRCDRVPLAYIIGHKEFYGRLFRVTPATLIPRPETESIFELFNEYIASDSPLTIIDVGTGTGCIGITLKLERPDCRVTLSDTSQAALAVAQKNAAYHHVDVECLKSNLLDAYTFTPDVIVANLPYVDPLWDTSPEVSHEPSEAIFAHHGGLALIYRLILQAEQRVAAGGYILLESDTRQHSAILDFAAAHGFLHRASRGYIQLFQRS